MVDDMVTVDYTILREACPDHGGWYSEQLQILGLTLPLNAGWMARVLGLRLSRAQADRLVALKNGPHPEQGLLFQR